jgi:hypothetical protein
LRTQEVNRQVQRTDFWGYPRLESVTSTEQSVEIHEGPANLLGKSVPITSYFGFIQDGDEVLCEIALNPNSWTPVGAVLVKKPDYKPRYKDFYGSPRSGIRAEYERVAYGL